MAGLDDYQFFSTLKEKDNPFWQKATEEKERMTDTYEHFRRPTEFPENLLNPAQPSFSNANNPTTQPLPPKAPAPSPRISEFELQKVPDAQMEKYGELSINIVSLCAENLLSHPFIVVRRQCQVDINSYRYHLLPITLFAPFVHIQSCQGFSAFWKGLGSVLTVKGITLALEDCLSKFTPWPKEISPHSSLKTIGQHLLLKCSALALITPFYSASLVETVQSEIASEKPGVFDVFREGLTRLLSFTQPQTGRMLPVWVLLVPTVTHGLMQYMIGNAVSTLTSQLLRRYHRQDQHKQGAVSKDNGSFLDASVRLQSAFVGHMAADVLLYPLETILHRLHMQGTRTIIDSLDVSYEVKPILTRYEGFFDCLSTTMHDEGVFGLFKGFGALCLQYALYGAVLKFAHVIIQEVTLVLVPPRPRPKTQDPVTPLAPSAPYTPISSLHGGLASLHPSPFTPTRTPQGTPLIKRGQDPSVRSRQVNLRAEMEKHKSNLMMDD